MTLCRVLSSIVHGDTDFCCLCFQEVKCGAVWIFDEVYTDSQGTHTMSEIINLTLGENMAATATAFGNFCYECKTSLTNWYKFKIMCNENIDNLISAVDSVAESFSNVLPDLDSYNTLLVSIDLNDFTSKQFYEDSHIENASEALKKLTILKKVKIKNVLKEKTGVLPKYVNKNDYATRKNSMVHDIPSIPTSRIIKDSGDTTSYICKVCHKSFKTELQVRCHYFKKHYPRHVKCKKCPRKFISKEILKYHEEQCHSTGICSECGKTFTSKYVLRKHILNHNLQITCGDCGRVYRSTEAYRKHIADDVCRQKSKKSADQAEYQCDYCKKRYNYKHYLSKHIMHEHGNAEGFRCKFCNKQFYTKSRLTTHILKHTREKNFLCTICNGRFVTRESLIYHTRLHTGEKPYQCEYCDKAFVSASRRLDHTRRYHLAPSLECDICHSKFKATGSLLKHRKRHLNPNSRLNMHLRQPYVVTSTEQIEQ